MPDLVGMMKESTASALAVLDPQEDLLPVLLTHGDNGVALTGLGVNIENDRDRDYLADVIVALMTVDRADSAMFSMMAWMWNGTTEPEGDLGHAVGATEIVMGIYITRDGHALHFAEVTRYDTAAPTIGEWQHNESMAGADGRMFAAMTLGLRLGLEMPDHMRETLDNIDRGEAVELLVEYLSAQRVAMQAMRN